MKKLVIAFVIGCLLAAGGTYAALSKKIGIAVTQKEELSGYTKYSDYITIGKQSLQGHTKILAATVNREETYTREIEKEKYGILKSKAAVAITYTGEYSFGYDLSPGKYEIKETSTGIEVVLTNKPSLISSPAIKNKKHKILSSGWLIDEKGEIINFYEGLDKVAEKNGITMASEEAIIALCEKKLIEFLKNFLAKQPGVKKVPFITVSYKS